MSSMTPSATPDGPSLEPENLPEVPLVGGAPPPPLEMIRPPEAGHLLARRWWIAGIAFYAAFVVVFVYSLLGAPGSSLLQLFGLGEARNPAVAVLVLGGIALFVAAERFASKDIRAIADEEEDINWVLKYKREGLPLVFMDKGRREEMYDAKIRSLQTDATTRVETLVDDRVRRMYDAHLGTGSAQISTEDLRGIAEKRTARFGSFTRYASSLLLLLAVLGTFAGVKTALPSLIQAVSASGGDGVQTALVKPLQAVADAFGGNALALVGAIAAGLMAQGLAVGRRNLLERLELVSAEYIYDNRRTQSADPLRAAVEALTESAEEIREASRSFGGIEGALQVLGDDFRSALVELKERLVVVVEQQDRNHQEDTARGLQSMQQQLAELRRAVDANSRVYQGLVDSVGARAAETRESVAEMRDATGQLTRGLEAVLRLGESSERASRQIDEALAGVASVAEQVREQGGALADVVGGLTPALLGVGETVRTASERIGSIDERAAKAWTEASLQITRQIAELPRASAADRYPASGPATSSSPTVSGVGPDGVALLRRIASAAEANSQRLTARTLVLLPMAGVTGAALLLYGIYRLALRFGLT
ncbi:MAG TPA: hypothetical protein VFE05_21245 [Longimicrobiaceae bacterium]|nr:hypothetical protein [Longimicrobiaceae bacterium]